MKEENKDYRYLLIAALGVVYGDIGTSPLYALKSCFTLTDIALTQANIMGLISLFFWILMIIVNFKYISLVMRCEQQGEGGVLILSSLLSKIKFCSLKKLITLLGIIAMALFVGDSIITPAISVLSAVEGIKLVAPISQNNVIIVSIFILSLLFALQDKGSAFIGKYFGFVMVIWFLCIGILGLIQIIKLPQILLSLNPYYAIRFLVDNGIIAWASLGGVILVVTGVEALYADMGHFGKNAIKQTWVYFVFPSLALNYLGQGALLLEDPKAITNPFFLLANNNLILPLSILSVMATIIASQAVISGLFSLTWQAIMLNYLPRMKVVHTSESQRGQIYVPVVNYIVCALSILAVINFRSSESIASAYGLSVASVMLITSFLVTLIALFIWKWKLKKIITIFTPLLILDIVFVVTSIEKLFEGAWYTLLIAFFFSYVMLIWRKGNKVLIQFKKEKRISLKEYLTNKLKTHKTRIPGCSIFMTRTEDTTPFSLELQLKHNKFFHEKLIFISVITEDEPKVLCEDKFTHIKLEKNAFVIKARFGFLEQPSLNKITQWANKAGIISAEESISVFLGRSIPVESKHGILKGFAEKLYIFLAKNSLPAYDFYKIDFNQVVELSTRYKV